MSDDNLQLDEAERHVDDILRSMTVEDLDLQTPPESIWAGIEADLTTDTESDRAESAPAETEGDLAPVITLASRRRPALFAAAVAAALVIVAGLAIAFTDSEDDAVEFASAELIWTPDYVDAGEGFSTSAVLVEDGDRLEVRLDDTALPTPPEGEDIELWLIGVNGDEITIIQPLGIVEDPARPGTFDVPASYDFDAYDTVLVDLSFEPRDGNPDHSGATFVRGPAIEV